MAIRIIPRTKVGWPQNQFQRIEIVNDAAASANALIPCDGLYRQSGTNQGVRFEVDKNAAASVTIYGTMDQQNIALNPAFDANVTWNQIGSSAVAAGDIMVDTESLHLTAIKLAFTNVGRVVISTN